MTYLEKVKEMYPELSILDIIDERCPYEFGLENTEPDAICSISCEACWHREFHETKQNETENVSIDDLKDAVGTLASIALDVICDETDRRRLDNAGIMIIDALSELEQYRESNGVVSISSETRTHIDQLADGKDCDVLSQSEMLEIHHAFYLMDALNKSIKDNTLVQTLASLLLNSDFGRCYMCKNSVKNITLDGKNNGCDGLCNVDNNVTVEQFLEKIVREIECNRNKEA